MLTAICRLPICLPACSKTVRESHRGVFAHPPAPRSFTTTGSQLLRDLLSIEGRPCVAALPALPAEVLLV